MNVLLAETILLWQTAAAVLALGVLLLLIFFGLKLRDADRLAAELRTERDTTARQQREMEDQAKAERQTLFNSMGEGVVLLDRSGRIQLVNQSLEKQFGLSIDVRGQTINEAFRRPELSQLLEHLEIERNLLSAELDVGGSEARYFEVTASRVFDREGRAQGAILVFHDLTRIRQLENTRREFVANVSHELRTPLSLIKGFVETLLEGAKDNPDLAGKFLRTIEKHADRLTFLIEDLLTISRLESGRTLTAVLEDALREAVARRKQKKNKPTPVELATFAGQGLQPGVDLDDSSALLDLMEGRN